MHIGFFLIIPYKGIESARFELPLNMSVLTEMVPINYLSKLVAISSARRQLYDKVFVRHRSLKDGLLTDDVSRRINRNS